MVSRKMGPRPEDEPKQADLQIVDEVLKEKTSSSTNTFLSRLGVGSSSRKSSVSTARIRELEHRLADQEEQSVQAAERYKQEMEARMQAQDQKFEEMTRKQEEELVAIKKAHEEKNLATEKRQ